MKSHARQVAPVESRQNASRDESNGRASLGVLSGGEAMEHSVFAHQSLRLGGQQSQDRVAGDRGDDPLTTSRGDWRRSARWGQGGVVHVLLVAEINGDATYMR